MFVAWRVNEVLSIQIEWPNSRGSHTHLRVSALTQSLVSQGKSILILTCAYLRGVWFQEIFFFIKEGPTSKLNSSKLGTCEGQHSFTLDYQTPL
jgi:hypothetical protein